MPLAFLSASSDCADLSPLLSRCSHQYAAGSYGDLHSDAWTTPVLGVSMNMCVAGKSFP